MTTTARDGRVPGPRTPAPDAGSVVAPPPKLRKRPGLVAAAVLVTALGCVLGAWAWNATTTTQEVLAATATIHRGEVITADDIQRIRISGDPALKPLPASAYDDIVGRRAALDIAAGGLITANSTNDAPMPPAGRSVVGIALTPAQVPALPLHGGDKVRIIVTPTADDAAGASDNSDATAGTPSFTVAEVVDTAVDETTGNSLVNVLVPYAEAGLLAAQAATGNVALVLDSEAE